MNRVQLNILIYMGQSQYAAFNLFAKQLTEPFRRKGHNVILFDLTQEGSSQKLIELFSSTHIDLVIAFNGMGVELTSGSKSIYDIVQTTFLAIFVDHPIYHISRLSQPIKNYIATFLDKSHVDFVDDLLPDNQVIKYFMPLAGSSSGMSCLNSYSEYLKTKDIDILFTGSYFGAPTKVWDNNTNLPKEILDQISDLLIHDEYTTIAAALKKVLGKHNIKLSRKFNQKNTSLMTLIMSYVRQYKRNELITKLCQHGIPITIYGKSWESMAKEFSTITFKGDVCTEETIALTKRAKIIITPMQTLHMVHMIGCLPASAMALLSLQTEAPSMTINLQMKKISYIIHLIVLIKILTNSNYTSMIMRNYTLWQQIVTIKYKIMICGNIEQH